MNAPVQNRQAKNEKKTCFFNFFGVIFFVWKICFRVPQVAWLGDGFLSSGTRFRTDFRRVLILIAETLVFTVFLCFLHA